VDLQRCAQESKGRQTSEEELVKFAQNLEGALRRLAGSSSRFLSDTEIKELAALYEKDPASEADKKRITELEAKAMRAARRSQDFSRTMLPRMRKESGSTICRQRSKKGTVSFSPFRPRSNRA
jgi:hypothetical protein